MESGEVSFSLGPSLFRYTIFFFLFPLFLSFSLPLSLLCYPFLLLTLPSTALFRGRTGTLKIKSARVGSDQVRLSGSGTTQLSASWPLLLHHSTQPVLSLLIG